VTVAALVSAELIKLADEELFAGHVLTSVSGWGPELEINLAMSSMGQDELGHARLLYGLAVGTDRDRINDLIYARPPGEFRAAALSSVYSKQWEMLVVKHFLYESADAERLRLLAGSTPELAEAAAKMRSEEDFHLEFWTSWFDRTARIDHARVQKALSALWPSAAGLFDFGEGGLFTPASAREAADGWSSRITSRLTSLGFSLPSVAEEPVDDSQRILDEMRIVYNDAPGRW
jgi:ring-1,2-phenylacetyl-CoA epoxidase subunit PaaC